MRWIQQVTYIGLGLDYLVIMRRRSTKMRSKASKKPVQARRTLVRVYDATNDDIIATWLRIPEILDCPILCVCNDCRRCWK